MHWSDAKMFCESRGMELPMLFYNVDVQEVSAALRSRLSNEKNKKCNGSEIYTFFCVAGGKSDENYYVWLYGSDIGQTPGEFYWSDGSLVSSSYNWAPGEPSRYAAGKQTCVILDTKAAKFRDYTCDTTDRKPLCERPAWALLESCNWAHSHQRVKSKCYEITFYCNKFKKISNHQIGWILNISCFVLRQ